MLKSAQEERRAIASINVYSFESIRGALLAAQKCRTPVILAFAVRYLNNLSLQQVVQMAQSCGKDVDIPYALHLAHCSQPEIIRMALDEGFSSVMFDGSRLSFEENVSVTTQVVNWAHDMGASTEAELGAICTGLNSAEDSGHEQHYTNPKQAKEFVQRTGVDALAVSIGTVHGMYKGTPHIRLDILADIRKETDVPLVLHGGSGTGKELLRQTIREGICKVNINTELSMHCVAGMRKAIEENSSIHLSKLSLMQIDLFAEAVEKYINILEC